MAPPSSYLAQRAEPRTVTLGDERNEIVYVRAAASLAFAAYAAEWLIASRESGLVGQIRWDDWLGMACCLAGAVLLNASLAAMGTSFSPTVRLSPDHTLVTWGPYRYVRHPIYLSYLLSSAGLLLVFLSWGFLLLMGFHLARLFRRIPEEEAALARQHGSAYTEYLATSGRLLPRIRALF